MSVEASWSPSAGESPDALVTDLTGYINWVAENTRNIIAQSLRDYGRVWVGSTLPARMTRGVQKGCFQNSWASASRSAHLVYAEGYAISGTLGLSLPMEHAWLVDIRTGTVIERTWDSDPKRPNVYLGLAVPAATMKEAFRMSRESTAVVTGDWARRGWFHRERLAEAAELTASLPQGM